jgi:hypothetical protein
VKSRINQVPIASNIKHGSVLASCNNDISSAHHTSFSPTSHSHSLGIADSGCTDLLLTSNSRSFLDDLQPHTELRVGTAAQGQFLHSTHRGDLRIPCKKGDIILPGYVFNGSNTPELSESETGEFFFASL